MASHRWHLELTYRTAVGYSWLDVDSGMVLFCRSTKSGQGWTVRLTHAKANLPLAYDFTDHRWAGFAFDGNFNTGGNRGWFVIFPFWFLSILAGLATFFAWHKTSIKVGGAFPIDASKTENNGGNSGRGTGIESRN